MKYRRYLLILLGSLILSGCMTGKYVGKPIQDTIRNPPDKPFSETTIAINDEIYYWGSFRSSFADYLEQERVFKNIYFVSDEEVSYFNPDLILISHKEEPEIDWHKQCSLGFEGMMVVIFTFGLVPNVCENQVVETFTFGTLHGDRTYAISFSHGYKTVTGWAAYLYNLFPDYSLDFHNKRYDIYNNLFVQSLYNNSEEIIDLVRKEGPKQESDGQ